MLGGIGGIVAIIFFVTAHEFGHFLAAKAVGIKATEFFFGFGPRLWSFRRGETEYGLKLLPLGGYVRVVGMNPLEEVAPEDRGRTYREKPFWKKSIVVLAGVGMNFLIAYLMFFGVLVADGVSELSTTIDEVVATFDDGRPTPAAQAGLRPGDRVAAVDGQATPDWPAVSRALGTRPGETIDLTVQRGDVEEVVTVTLASRVNPDTGVTTGFLGVAPEIVERSVGVLEAGGLAGRQLTIAVSATFEVLGRIVHPDTLARLAGAFVGNTDVPDEIRPVSPIGVINIGSQVDELGVVPVPDPAGLRECHAGHAQRPAPLSVGWGTFCGGAVREAHPPPGQYQGAGPGRRPGDRLVRVPGSGRDHPRHRQSDRHLDGSV